MKKVDSSVFMDRHADKSARDDDKKVDSRDLWIATILLAQNLAMTEKRRFCVKKILGIAVGLWLFYTNFGAELDLWSAVVPKFV